MKTRLSILIIFLSFATGAQTSKAADEELLKQLIIDSFQDILSDNKQEKLGDYYTEDFVLLENGEVWDREIIKGYMDQAAGMGDLPTRINSFSFIDIKIYGDVAWLAYHNNARFEKDGEVLGEMNWLESAQALRTVDGWKLELLHSTLAVSEEEEE